MKKQKVESIYQKSSGCHAVNTRAKALYFLLSALHISYNFTTKVLYP